MTESADELHVGGPVFDSTAINAEVVPSRRSLRITGAHDDSIASQSLPEVLVFEESDLTVTESSGDEIKCDDSEESPPPRSRGERSPGLRDAIFAAQMLSEMQAKKRSYRRTGPSGRSATSSKVLHSVSYDAPVIVQVNLVVFKF